MITTEPSATAQSGVVFAQQPVVQLRDASGNTVSQSGAAVTAAIATGAGTLGGTLTATTNPSGVATFTDLTITGTAGDRTLSFSASGISSATSTTVTITAAAATQLSVTTEPSSSAQSGVAFAQQPVVQLRDPSGNPVSEAGVTVGAAIASGGGTLGGTATAITNGSGVATYTNLAISGTAGDRTLSFSASGLTAATSTTITITAGAATQLSIATQPSSAAQSGVALAQQPVLQIQDASGNPVSQSGTVVTATIASGPSGATLSNASATTQLNGAATFSGLAISGAAGSYTLSFAASGVTSVVSGIIALTSGPAATMTNNSPTSQSAPAGTAVASAPSVIVRDASGNPVAGVEVTFATGLNSGTVDPTTPIATGTDGIATVTSWVLAATPGPNTLTATASPTGISGDPVLFTAAGTPGPPSSSRSSMSAAPTTITASTGASVATITVTVLDAFGNAVQGATVALAASGSNNTLTQPLGTTDVNGQITGTLSSTMVEVKTISATVNGSVPINQTATVTVGPAAADHLTFTSQPQDVNVGGTLSPVVVSVWDAFGNLATGFGGNVKIAIGTDPSLFGAKLGGTSPVMAISGAATFDDLTIDQIGVGYTLVATSNGLTPATSSGFTVLALLP